MKQLTCEMCGSTDLVKQDGVFVCQTCGCKYSTEEAKKMMVEGIVEVTGTVKVDSSEKLKNLYQIARQARDNENNDSAAKNYELILMEDPTSWEANFYSVYCKAMVCTIGGIPSAANSISNCLRSVFLQISGIQDEKAKNKAALEVADKAIKAATLFVTAAANSHLNLRTDHPAQFVPDFTKRAFAGAGVAYTLGDVTADIFRDKIWGLEISISAYNSGNSLLKTFKTAVKPRGFLETAPIHSSVAADTDKLISKYTAKANAAKDYVVKKKHEEVEKEIQEQFERNKQYWAEHASEKADLDKRKTDLESQLNTIGKSLSALEAEKTSIKAELSKKVPAEEKCEKMRSKRSDLESHRSSLGLFKGKEKKQITQEIDELDLRLTEIEKEISAQKERIKQQFQPQIDALDTQLAPLRVQKSELGKQLQDIKTELTKNR